MATSSVDGRSFDPGSSESASLSTGSRSKKSGSTEEAGVTIGVKEKGTLPDPDKVKPGGVDEKDKPDTDAKLKLEEEAKAKAEKKRDKRAFIIGATIGGVALAGSIGLTLAGIAIMTTPAAPLGIPLVLLGAACTLGSASMLIKAGDQDSALFKLGRSVDDWYQGNAKELKDDAKDGLEGTDFEFEEVTSSTDSSKTYSSSSSSSSTSHSSDSTTKTEEDSYSDGTSSTLHFPSPMSTSLSKPEKKDGDSNSDDTSYTSTSTTSYSGSTSSPRSSFTNLLNLSMELDDAQGNTSDTGDGHPPSQLSLSQQLRLSEEDLANKDLLPKFTPLKHQVDTKKTLDADTTKVLKDMGWKVDEDALFEDFEQNADGQPPKQVSEGPLDWLLSPDTTPKSTSHTGASTNSLQDTQDTGLSEGVVTNFDTNNATLHQEADSLLAQLNTGSNGTVGNTNSNTNISDSEIDELLADLEKLTQGNQQTQDQTKGPESQ